MILIISNTQDLTTDFVVRELHRKKLPFFRLNTDEFPNSIQGMFSIENDASQKTILKWTNRNKILDCNSVKSVYYRRPVNPVPNALITDSALRKFCTNESYIFLRGLWYMLGTRFWISPPDMIRKAENKIYQLQVAKNIGFNIPSTIVTNNPNHVLEFYHIYQEQGIIVKPLSVGFIDHLDSPKFIYTSEVTNNDLAEIESIAFAPSIFQEKISKLYDLRITVVGNKVFSVKIETPRLPERIPDWRYPSSEDLIYSEYDLPKEIEMKCTELVQQLNLNFGAIDMIVDKYGKHFFLENNPNGQWAWLENSVDLPISEAIVQLLVNGK